MLSGIIDSCAIRTLPPNGMPFLPVFATFVLPLTLAVSNSFLTILLCPFVASQLLSCCVYFSKFCQSFAHFFGAWHLLRARHELGLRAVRLAALGVLYISARKACGLPGLRPSAIYIYLRQAPGAGPILEARVRALIRKKREPELPSLLVIPAGNDHEHFADNAICEDIAHASTLSSRDKNLILLKLLDHLGE